MRKVSLFLVLLFFIILPSFSLYAKNLRSYTEDGKTLNIFLNNFSSLSDKVNPEQFKEILADALKNRKSQKFSIMKSKDGAQLYIDCTIKSFLYLEKDPIDQFSAGTTGLIVDAFVSQNYAKIEAEFSVYRAKDDKNMWSSTEVVTVTQSNMPEADSIPKVLQETAKRFIFKCFGKRRE